MDFTRRRRSFSLRFGRLTVVIASAAILPATLAAPADQASAATSHSLRAHPQPRGNVARRYGPLSSHTGSARVIPHPAASRAALARARATGRPVVIAPDTTTTSQTIANPNGTFTATINALPVRVRQHGAWVPVSARLKLKDGTLSPAAAAEPVTLSAGGTGPLAVLHGPNGSHGPNSSYGPDGSHGYSLTLWFPGGCPRP